DAYRLLAQHGATEIVSVHIGSTVSGTLNSAHLAAREADVPVHLVDTGAASFVVGAAAIEAAGAAAQGAAAAEVMAIAERTAGACGNVFIVGGLDFMRAGGRLDASLAGEPLTVPVLSLVDGTVSQIGSAANPDEATALMVDAVRDSGAGAGARVKATVGTSDVWSFDIGDQLDKRLSATDGVDVARYRIGPSVGAHTGPGSVGVVFYPSESRQVAVLS
nr:DegV family EDD domain-containing protein [Actinomycetota bacterium]